MITVSILNEKAKEIGEQISKAARRYETAEQIASLIVGAFKANVEQVADDFARVQRERDAAVQREKEASAAKQEWFQRSEKLQQILNEATAILERPV